MRFFTIVYSLCLFILFACDNEDQSLDENKIDTSVFVTTSNSFDSIEININSSLYKIRQDTIFPFNNKFRKVFRCPSVVITSKGTILVSSENRETLDDKGKIDVVVARKEINEKNWLIKRVYSYDPTSGRYMNPVFIVDEKRIYLFAANMRNDEKYGRDQTANEADFIYKYSDDDGLTWSAPHSLNSSRDTSTYTAIYPSASNGIITNDGAFLLPSLYVKNHDWYAGLLIHTKERGFYFSKCTPCKGDNESTIYFDNHGRLVLDCRTYERGRRRYFYDLETDTYIETEPPFFLEENMTDIKMEVTKDSGLFFMGYPDSFLNTRDNISLYGSKDGINWKKIYHMMEGFTLYGYSNIAIDRDRMLVCFEVENGVFLQDLSGIREIIYAYLKE